MKRSYSIRAFLWHTIIGIFIFLIAILLTYLDIPELRTYHDTLYTISACAIPYVLTGYVIERLLFIPPIEGNAIILLSTFLSYTLTAILLVEVAPFLSWWVFLLTTALTGIAYYWAYRHHIHTNKFRFIFINQNTLDRFLLASQFYELPHRTLLIDFSVLNNNTVTPQDIFVWDPDEITSTLHLRQLLFSKDHHFKNLSLGHAIELLTARISPDHLNYDFIKFGDRLAYDSIKRIFDWMAAILLTLSLAPLFLVIVIAIMSIDGRPIFFQQKRVGLNGKVFNILKFRTMKNSNLSRFEKPKYDENRITPLGKWLRRHRIDELPQIYNVIKGDMSFIGPRPEYAGYARLFRKQIPHYEFRHLIRPGITGWAQVQQGHNTGSLEAAVKLSYDLYYVKHYSLTLDLLIAFKTLRILITGYGGR